jgi:murein tripeptide amidase MpaA
MYIASNFDSGNIEVLDISPQKPTRLEIRPDSGTEFLHWFLFQYVAKDADLQRFEIMNAGQSRTPEGWKRYRVAASYDRRTWFRVPTRFDGEVLAFELKPEHPSVFFGHFAPYTLGRQSDLLARCQTNPDVRVEVLGESVEKRPISVMRIGKSAGGPNYWITTGQHPGEPMGPWLMEGLLHRLLDQDDGIAALLRNAATFHVVPTMNPDGSFRGNLRTNAAGVDLNRAWLSPDQHSPEVICVRNEMERIGVDLLLDVHGDETLPYCFVVPSDNVPSGTQQLIEKRRRFEAGLEATNPDFQRVHGYPPERPGSADLNIGANWVQERFGCVAAAVQGLGELSRYRGRMVAWAQRTAWRLYAHGARSHFEALVSASA